MTKLGYRMTEIGEIPEEWNIKKISELKQNMYYGITAKATKENTNLRMLRTTDIKNFKFNLDNLPFCEITEKRSDLSKYFLKRNDIIIARAGTVGVSILVQENLNNVLFGSYLIKIIFKQETIDMTFIHYYFQSQLYWNNISNAQGSTIKNINLPFLNSLEIPLPPLPEQQKIAEILSTADDEIQKVDEQITLTEHLKKGLMQKLLTRGIGHTRFKMTEIGEIPEEWDFRKLEEVSILRKEVVDPRNFIGKIYLGLEHLTPGDPKITSYGNPTDVTSSKWKFYSGDILYGKLRPYLDKVVVADRDGISSTDIYIIVSKNVQPNFLLYLLHTKRLIEYVTSASVGTNHPRISWEILKDFEIPFPPNEEQIRISEILITIDEKIVFLKDKKTMLETLKKGLMNDLLTGKVRVKV